MVVEVTAPGFETNRIQTFAGKAEDRRRSREPDNAIRITIGTINGPVTKLYHDLAILNLQQKLGADTAAQGPLRSAVATRACCKRVATMRIAEHPDTKLAGGGLRRQDSVGIDLDPPLCAEPYIALAVLQHAMS